MNIKFSVIIPALNEAQCIQNTIKRIRDLDETAQIIVADAESSDETIQLCQKAKVEIVFSRRGRGPQCNAGSAKASGDVLLFLHADTLLPENAFKLLTNYFSNDNIMIGTFRLGFDVNNVMLRFYCSFTKFDSMFTRFGDQCIVIRKSFFKQIGGFPDWPLFEDVHLLRLARRHAKIISFPSQVITSARRFMTRGIIKTQLLNGFLLLLYLLGVSPVLLANWYAIKNREEMKLQTLQRKMIRI
jgi:rSAM/selenodomain-associated transferase 2